MRSSSLRTQNSDNFNMSQLPLLNHSDLTLMASNNTGFDHGCLVLNQRFDSQREPDIFVSKQTLFWLKFIATTAIVSVLSVVGVPANILSAAVFYKQGLKERINFCIFCLALVDLVVITEGLCRMAEERYRYFIGPANFYIKYFVGLVGFYWVSMLLSTVIAAERCFCVVSPLRAQRMLSTGTLAVIVTSISGVILAGKLVVAGLKHTEVCAFDPKTNSTFYTDYYTDYYRQNKVTFDIINTFVYGTALPLVFFAVVVITTVITTIQIKSAVTWRQQSSTASGPQPTRSSEYHMISLTRMLIATSVLFVVCICPLLFVQMAMFFGPDLSPGGPYYNLLDALRSFLIVFRFVNSSLNFFVYYQMGSRFRQTLTQLLSCKGTKH